MSSQYILYAIVAVGIFTAYMAVVNLLRADRMKTRLRGVTGAMGDEERGPPALEVFCRKAVALTGASVEGQKELQTLLLQAGIQSPYAVTYALFFKRIVQPVLFVLGLAVFVKMVATSGMPRLERLLDLAVAVILLAVGLFGSSLYITNAKQRRQQILLRSFPEVLDLLLVCIESGLGLDAALARASGEMRGTHPVISGEIDRTRMELTLLPDRVQALQNLAERTEIVPFKALVSSLIQTEKFGTSLVDTLRVLSEDQRTTRLLNAENRAARIPVLITIPLILCILPAFIMIILGPPIVKVINQGGIFGSATPK